MAPLPETEIMTLKRLEVALKKGDFALLRDGTYKLHEKFHGGFKFEFLDLLKDILNTTQNSNVPMEIKDILIPTIEDILSNSTQSNSTSPYENAENRVSSLTSLSYSTNEDENDEQDKMSAFDAFGTTASGVASPIQPQYNPSVSQVPQSELHFEEISMPQVEFSQTTPENTYETQKTIENKEEVETQNMSLNQTEVKPQIISIIFAQNNSEEKHKNIKKYQEMLEKLEYGDVGFLELINTISILNTQSNANIAEIQNIFEQLQNKNVKINLLTNCANANIVALMESIKIPYKMNSTEEKVNIMSLFGMSNIFKCSNCSEEYLDIADRINPYILECPKCKKPMFPKFSSVESGVNLKVYNNAIVNLASSDSWLIINPSNAEDMLFDILKSAAALNRNVKNIYIQDKDINKKEIYKNAFYELDNTLDINININVIEDFLKPFNIF